MLILTAVAEVATGAALLIIPSLVGRLLFGEELTGVAIPVARVTGILLWPAVVLHAILTALLTWASTSDKKTKSRRA